jgi:hypothetical protein
MLQAAQASICGETPVRRVLKLLNPDGKGVGQQKIDWLKKSKSRQGRMQH